MCKKYASTEFSKFSTTKKLFMKKSLELSQNKSAIIKVILKQVTEVYQVKYKIEFWY